MAIFYIFLLLIGASLAIILPIVLSKHDLYLKNI